MRAPTDYGAVRCTRRDGAVRPPLRDGDRLAGHSHWVEAGIGPGYFVPCRGDLVFRDAALSE